MQGYTSRKVECLTMLATHAPENTDNNDSLKYFGCIWHVTNKIPKKLDFSRQFDLTC